MAKVRGRVEAINDTGMKINGEWWNFSKYHEAAIPNEGDLVEVELKDKWIKSVQFFNKEKKVKETVDRDTRISRLALLNTATAILTTHKEPIGTFQVIKTAKELEDYVFQEEKEVEAENQEDEDVPF